MSVHSSWAKSSGPIPPFHGGLADGAPQGPGGPPDLVGHLAAGLRAGSAPVVLLGEDGGQPEPHEPAPQGVLPVNRHAQDRRRAVRPVVPDPVDEGQRPLVAVGGGGDAGDLGEDGGRAPGQGEQDVSVVPADRPLQGLDRGPRRLEARQDAGVQHPRPPPRHQVAHLGRSASQRPDERPRDRVRGRAPAFDADDEDVDVLGGCARLPGQAGERPQLLAQGAAGRGAGRVVGAGVLLREAQPEEQIGGPPAGAGGVELGRAASGQLGGLLPRAAAPTDDQGDPQVGRPGHVNQQHVVISFVDRCGARV